MIGLAEFVDSLLQAGYVQLIKFIVSTAPRKHPNFVIFCACSQGGR